MSLYDDTDIGGCGGEFPTTSWTQIRAAGRPEERAEQLGPLLAAYWKPVYCYLRARWDKSNEEAKDLTQEFISRVLDGKLLEQASPESGSFRAFLKTVLHHFVVDDHRRRKAVKRGGDRRRVGVQPDQLEGLAGPAALSPEEQFNRAWIASCVEQAARRLEGMLQEEGRPVHAELFRAYFLDSVSPRPSHDELAARFALTVAQVGNHLLLVRRRMRKILCQVVREYSGSEEQAAEELRWVLGQ